MKKIEVVNKVARFEYDILSELECGIVLTGTEIKSVRSGKCNIRDSYAIIKGHEVYLLNSHIAHYENGNIFNHDETRLRKLLLHKSEIRSLEKELKTSGITLIPLKLYMKRGKLKCLLGVCRGRKTYDKKNVIKQRDLDKDAKRELASYK